MAVGKVIADIFNFGTDLGLFYHILSFLVHEGEPLHNDKVVAIWPYGHEFELQKQPLTMEDKTIYNCPMLSDPSPEFRIDESFVHWTAFLYSFLVYL